MTNVIETLIEGSVGKTRSGHEIIDIRFSSISIDRPLCGFVLFPGEYPSSSKVEWKEDGSFRFDGMENKLDIISISPPPTKIEKLKISNEYVDECIDEIFTNEAYNVGYLGDGKIGETFILFKKEGKPMYSFMLCRLDIEGAHYKLLFTNKNLL